MRKEYRVLFLVLVLLLAQTPVFAWGDTGHMVVAAIAFSRLNSTASKRVNHLVSLLQFRGKTYNPITVANMMDDFRDDPTKDSFKPWHFTNRPFVDGITPKPGDIIIPKINVEERIQFLIGKLKQGGLTEKQEAAYVAYLIHLVGDIHQPLHSVSRYSKDHPKGTGDEGGNFFLIDGPRRKLHSYWDAAGGLFNFQDVTRPLTSAGWKQINNFAFDAKKAYPDTNPEWKDLDVSHWVDESFNLAVNAAYKDIQQHTRPDSVYQERAQAVSRRRIAMGGYRLAAILNEIYPKQ